MKLDPGRLVQGLESCPRLLRPEFLFDVATKGQGAPMVFDVTFTEAIVVPCNMLQKKMPASRLEALLPEALASWIRSSRASIDLPSADRETGFGGKLRADVVTHGAGLWTLAAATSPRVTAPHDTYVAIIRVQ